MACGVRTFGAVGCSLLGSVARTVFVWAPYLISPLMPAEPHREGTGKLVPTSTIIIIITVISGEANHYLFVCNLIEVASRSMLCY